MKKSIPAYLILFCLVTSCVFNEKPSYKFELLRKEATGLDFQNELKQSSQFNVFNYMYFFNGGGIAAEDLNNDGLVDLYFTSNMGPNKLFLNQGNLQFTDVTEQAGVEGIIGWSTGATVVDINQDGLMDIYLCQVGDYLTIKGQNQLFICQGIENGIPIYQDESIRYGLDLIGFSTQASFFDYDLDGDLDMFQLNHSLHENGTFGNKENFNGTQHPTSGDKLLRNDGDKFTEVTMEAGINSTVIGYGLGVVVGDINLDGWPDIYIGNDFHENDYLYLNQQDGTFKESLTDAIRHTSRFSMGVDMADINNDGWSEILSLDMLPEDPIILKESLGEDDYDIFHFKLTFGYNHQYARNNLQLNLGTDQDGTPIFSEIGRFAGVEATDWSWASLFFDFDHDGYKDLFVSNGIPRRMNNIDYVNFMANNELRWKAGSNRLEEDDLILVEKMPEIKLPNKFFKNSGQLKFDEIGDLVKNAAPSYSNGAVYADFDNDGDLDIVVNNIADEPFLYKNNLVENGTENQYLHFKLKGSPQNINAIGAKIMIETDTGLIISENFRVRGYQSSLTDEWQIGLGKNAPSGKIKIIWPDNTYSVVNNPKLNQPIEVAWHEGLDSFDYQELRKKDPPKYDFADVSSQTGIDYRHEETNFIEFHREGLIPHMVSTEGPAVAVGDVNGDDLDDIYFGSAKFEKSALYFQQADGTFQENTPTVIALDSVHEEVDAAWVDLENDGDLDLVVASGGNEFWGEDEAMKQRAYFNDGSGQFTRYDFPGAHLTASCVLPEDFNNDGYVDLFFGGRSVPWNYGKIPRSHLFMNNGDGTFKNVSEQIGNPMHEAGLVKDGAWADINNDGNMDLVLAIEWGPITVFYNYQDRFEAKPLSSQTGWWNYALPFDADGDGDLDILAGNLGENSKLRPTIKEPVKMYVNDFDDNDQVEQILTYYVKGKEIPFANYMEITKQLTPLKKKYLFAKDFASASLSQIFGKEKLNNSIYHEANTFQSIFFENVGKGNFEPRALPKEMQFSDQRAALAVDLDKDGTPEVLTGGNFYESNIEMGRYDADFGHVLSFTNGDINEVSPLGPIKIEGQVRHIAPISINGAMCFIFIINDGLPVILKYKNEDMSSISAL